ncbi:hypothetical protein S7711_07811 [Stachybotrys chartarum IBT 7711]|uniref:Uncharacterized protein n=1 Tax=Stachybotrys chartarum (strain CBS 109288 / IBT 7711) TaxID=1280523 RepID=A0A084AQN5_STACB|nr:hypothetical protein S7711_07811 [Stachybotrys chartarum IBT 7711]KFA51461.1 hypothetical protein S40293_06750 [Stachybotrys chartarum IBT 40293]
MENESPTLAADEARSSRRGRLMGKLFGGIKDRKPDPDASNNLDDFLRSSPDNLQVTHAPPPLPPSVQPKLAKLDTTSISRYPQALAVNQQAQLNRPMVPGTHSYISPQRSPRPHKKNLVVRFVDTYPDIIGEGGDESEMPTMEISKNRPPKPSASPRPPVHRSPLPSPGLYSGAPSTATPASGASPFDDDAFQPKPLRRTQTGYSSIYEPEEESKLPIRTRSPPPLPILNPPSQESVSSRAPDAGDGRPKTLVPGKAASARYLETTGRHDENRRSFIEVHQAEMRQAEGQAFAKAARTAGASAASQQDQEYSRQSPLDGALDSPESSRQRPLSVGTFQDLKLSLDHSPIGSIRSVSSSVYSPPESSQPSFQRQGSVTSQVGLATPSVRSASFRLADAVSAASDDALNTFVTRTKHLFELFRLHAEAVKPISTSQPKDCGRAGLWWFLRGRMGLEVAVRGRPNSPQSQMQNEIDRQQAYTNLAKGYWLCVEVVTEITQSGARALDTETNEVSQALTTALRKLAVSMKRNGFLPPEEAFLPQTIDKSIWVEYPPMSQDMVALLTGNWGSGMSAMQQQPLKALHLLDALPLGDTAENFSYGRVMADVYLMEQGREAQRFYFPCVLSMVRPQKQAGLFFVLASQNGSMQLVIQENKNVGPVWDDVRWRNDTCTIDVRLPRGFVLAVQVTQQDYRTLWNMYDFGIKTQATLYPRSGESVVFRNTLKSFQCIDGDPQSRMFPKEAVPGCDVALFEKTLKENGPSGPRNWHRGFRIAVVTGPRTRTLSGVNQTYPPLMPVQFGFIRGDGEKPAFSLRFESGRQKGHMVLVFNDDAERVRFHSLLTGTALDSDEKLFADVPLKSYVISQSLREPLGIPPFNRMPWKAARVVNEEMGDDGGQPPVVLADRLKIIVEYQNGTITDRVNVAPGELRLRLEVTNARLLRILRQPQQDVTISVSEAHVPKELPRNLSDALELLRNNQTIRNLEFNNLKDLHDFQRALTGFEVIFDALAATFAIARRRMVVPIHKKWEAGFTRIQVVRNEDKQLQLLAFFEDFQHGHCMNFVLKGTDVYESMNRSGKPGIKFIDAKFPLPRLPDDKDGDYDDMAFVCLDLPDLPGEHDDISIVFEKESDRDHLAQCLPAPLKGGSRLTSRFQ